MATQTVTNLHPPAPAAASHAHNTAPPRGGAVDYSMTDLDILESPSTPDPQSGTGGDGETAGRAGTAQQEGAASSAPATAAPLAEFEAAFALPDIGAKLREICERDAAYRAVFPDANAARAASTAQVHLANLDRVIESRDPRAHGELLAGMQRNSPEAFRALAVTFAEDLSTLDPAIYQSVATALAAHPPVAAPVGAQLAAPSSSSSTMPTANQFLESVNADVETSVRESVGRRVEELLPDAPEGARTKIAGEIFRELDESLRQDPELREHVRESIHNALRAMPGASNLAQREALARLIAARARAALPGVAKRVVADWTETVLRSSQSRRTRQSESASRVEVGRGGAPAPVSLRPRSVDYTRMSDEEILNME